MSTAESSEETFLFATEPVCLTSLPLLGREEALFKTFEILFERWFKRRHKTITDRTQNPFIFFPASPGLGKTRMLNALTRIPKPPNDDRLNQFNRDGNNIQAKLDDNELKWAVIEAIRGNRGNIRGTWISSPANAVEEFCDLMLQKTCGIILTFNERTPLVPQEREGNVSASEMLGVRIAFETKLVEGCDYGEFPSFLTSLKTILGDQRPTLDWALNCAVQLFGVNKHIILGVDEVLLGAGVANYDHYVKADSARLEEMLILLGIELDRLKNLHLVLTSLSYSYFDDQKTTSGRSLRALTLRNLKVKESLALAQFYHDDAKLDDTDVWIDDKDARQIVEDCDGAPRLLENVFRYLKPNKSLKQLRGLCMQVEPISRLNVRNQLVVVALVLALRGSAPSSEEARCYDEAVYMGYLMSSSVLDENKDKEPIFPLMTMLCLCEKSKPDRDPDHLRDLWRYIQLILRFDPDEEGNSCAGNSFAAFFRHLWRLRCLTNRFQVYEIRGTGAIARSKASISATMKDMLMTFGKVPDISTSNEGTASAFDLALEAGSPMERRFGGDRSPWKKVTEDEVYFREYHQILMPNNPNEPGLDNILTFPLPSQRNKVKGKKRNVDSFLASVRNNFSVLSRAIEDNLFGFIVVLGSPCCDTVSTQNVRELINESLLKSNEQPNIKTAILAASWHIAIMKREDVLNFMPRSFRSRSQFRLERDFAS